MTCICTFQIPTIYMIDKYTMTCICTLQLPTIYMKDKYTMICICTFQLPNNIYDRQIQDNVDLCFSNTINGLRQGCIFVVFWWITKQDCSVIIRTTMLTDLCKEGNSVFAKDMIRTILLRRPCKGDGQAWQCKFSRFTSWASPAKR